MKLLVVGGGGREHAIIRKLKQNPAVTKIVALPGNAGIAQDAECVPIRATDIDGIAQYVRENPVDFAVVAPDDPLALGCVDRLHALGVPCFGPDAKAARIEASKVFAKDLMKKYGIPTAAYETFDDAGAALDYVKSCALPVVVKADGLALGKGVTICFSRAEAEAAVKAAMLDGAFGASGSRIVVEEYLEGPEVSVLSFTVGKTVVPMISSMDHKRAGDNDTGLNTGGMGTVSPNPYYTEDIAKECMEKIFLPTMNAMNAEGRTFEGCLYFGLMLTPKGPKVIEYNCRFGDPETQVVLPMLDADLYEIFEAIYDHTLDKVDIKWHNGSCACVVMASGGYPESYPKGIEMNGFDDMGQVEGCFVYHAGTKVSEDGKFLTNGGRVIGVTARGENLSAALDTAYNGVSKISFEGAHFRRDIGQRALAALK